MAPDLVVDAASGSIQITADGLERLGHLAAAGYEPGALSGDDATWVADAGLLREGAIDPTWTVVIRALGEPLVRLTLEVLRPLRASCSGWVTEEAFLMAVPTHPDDGERFSLILVSASELPARLGAFVGLGPRPRPRAGGILPTERGILDAFLGEGGDPAKRFGVFAGIEGEEAEAWTASLTVLASKVYLHWRVIASWIGPDDGSDQRSLEVIDGGRGGLWQILPLLDESESAVGLVPTSATDVWRSLTLLLPDDEELAAPGG